MCTCYMVYLRRFEARLFVSVIDPLASSWPLVTGMTSSSEDIKARHSIGSFTPDFIATFIFRCHLAGSQPNQGQPEAHLHSTNQ